MQPPFVFALPNHVTGIKALGHLHEARKRLTPEQRDHYISELMRKTVGFPSFYWSCMDAEPREHAEALYTIITPRRLEMSEELPEYPFPSVVPIAPLSTQPETEVNPCPENVGNEKTPGNNAAPTGPIPADAATPRTDAVVNNDLGEKPIGAWLTMTAHARQLERELTQALKERDNWIDTAAQYARNEEFYHGLVVAIGESFGVAAKTSDDGSIQDHVLALKVPELVAALRDQLTAMTQERDNLRATISAVREIVHEAPELNMRNYNEEQVSELNQAMIDADKVLQDGTCLSVAELAALRAK